jgi:hypothetical protein
MRVAVCAVLAMPLSARAQELSPDLRLLVGIKEHIRQQIAMTLDYTCLETIQRLHRPPGRNTRLETVDTVHLEVLYTGRRELYSSPGARHFADDTAGSFVASGIMAGGAFGSFVDAVFTGGATYKYKGTELLRGSTAARYDFHLSSFVKPLTISLTGSAPFVTGLEGSFWADAASLDLIRLEVRPDDVPPYLPIQDIGMTLDYAPVRLGALDLTVPQAAEYWLAKTSGEEDRNQVEFSQCRKFEADSSLSFLSPGAEAPPVPVAATTPSSHQVAPPQTIPAGLEVDLRLARDIDDAESVGTLLSATVAADVRAKGKIVIPKGTVVTGRLRRLERHSDDGEYWIVSIEFVELELAGAPARFFADLVSMDRIPGYESILSTPTALTHGGSSAGTRTENRRVLDPPGVASFFVRGTHVTLSKGLRMVWKTLQ